MIATAECRVMRAFYEIGRLAFLHSPASQSHPGLAEHWPARGRFCQPMPAQGQTIDTLTSLRTAAIFLQVPAAQSHPPLTAREHFCLFFGEEGEGNEDKGW